MKVRIKKSGGRGKGFCLKDGSGKGKGRPGGLRKNKTATCRHPKKK